jgi:SAM-dependent methyltransferase
MAEEAQTWHYGLVARYWAEFRTDGPEIAYFQGVIERYGQPAIDVACGAGRLLVPYMRAGLDVDGCDLSADMLTLCRERAEREGLEPRLYRQAMHVLDLPRLYRTIFLCGSFGLGGGRELAQKGLERFYDSLEPGGVLAFDHYLPYDDTHMWQYWLPENRSKLPEDWPPPGERRRMSDGSELGMRARVLDFDPLEQVGTRQMRAEQWRDGALIAQEEYTLKGSEYFKNEILLMLERARFRDVAIYKAWTDQAATVGDGVVVFIAKK